ncbi:MAG TPA: DNA polymerase III subunit delta, partial [Verrucomicrobiaceae bacterium]
MPAAKKSSSTRAPAAPSNFAAVLGTDEALVKDAALKLSRELAPADAGDFGADVIDGIAENAEHCERIVRGVMDALQTLPFFGGGKLVWLKNANFLADNQVGKTNAALEGIEAILDYVEQQLPPEVKFLLSATGVDKRRSAFKRIQKLARLQVFDKPDISKAGWEAEVLPFVERRSREMGLSFDEGALEMFVQLAGEDSRQLESELEKLRLYLDQADRVTVADVRAVVPLTKGGVIFEVGNAIAKRDLRRALELVRTLVYQGQNPVGILLGAIVPRVRSLLLAADLLANHPRLPRGSYQAFIGALERLPS